MGNRDRSTIIGFVLFWVVLGIGCWVGLLIAHSMGLGQGPASSAGAAPAKAHTTRHAPEKARAPQLTLQSIFASGSPRLSGYDPRKLRTMVATGDVIPARSVNYMMVTRNDFLYPFRPTANFVRNADITLINLESPLISTGCPVTVEGMSFCGDPRVVAGLKYAGVDVACTANNHIGNFGVPAIHETWQHLAA